MRVVSVRAASFGSLNDSVLNLDDRFMAIHGPNEAAKSTWHAALLAGLCGMRRGRGKPRAEDSSFELRHAPWFEQRWSVQLQCQTDEGLLLELTHDLRERTATIIDTATGDDLAGSMMFDGAPDGSILLGLDRRIFRSTAWVRQADIASVREDPAALQALMQAVAENSESSASDAIGRIDSFRQVHVGSDRLGSSRPLRAARDQVVLATTHLETAKASQGELHRLQANLRSSEQRIDSAETALGRMVAMHRASERDAVALRLTDLMERSEQMPEAPAGVELSEALFARVQEALRTWVDLGDSHEELPEHDDDADYERLRELRDNAAVRRDAAQEMSLNFRDVHTGVSEESPGLAAVLRGGIGLLAALCALAGFVNPVAWLLAAVLAVLWVVIWQRPIQVSSRGELMKARGRLHQDLANAGIDEVSLIDGYRSFEDREQRFQGDQSRKITSLEEELEQRRRSGATLVQLRAQRYAAVDAVSAAVIAVGAAPYENAAQDVAFLERWSSVYETERVEAQTLSRRWQALQLELERTPLDALRTQLDTLSADVPADTEALSIPRAQMNAAVRELGEVREAKAELAGRLSTFTREQSVGDAEVALAAAERTLSRVQQLDFALLHAGEQLREAQISTYRSLAPRLQQRLGAMLARVTQQRYKRVAISPDDLSVKVEVGLGEWKDAAQLSHGTAEVVYLLLRVVLAEELGDSLESCPLILDDITVHLDEQRTIAILELLWELSESRQIILFSQEETVRLWAEQNLAARHLHSLYERG